MITRVTNTSQPTSQSDLSESNRANIFSTIYNNGILSRAQIAKTLHLTPAAVTKITAKLLEEALIIETGGMEGSKKRRSIGLSVNTDYLHVIGVKFARSLVQIGVFDMRGTMLALHEMPQVQDSTITETLHSITDYIEHLLEQDHSIVAIGMAVPGPYLRNVGRIAVVSSMQGWTKVNFLHEFEHSFRVPVFIEQDARAGALAQALFDDECKSTHADSIAYYLIGEGVGLGVIEQGTVINGHLGVATELGHVSIDMNGRQCECGNRGCLECYCSTHAIQQRLIELGDIVPQAAALSSAQAARTLFELVDEGDTRARELLTEIAQYIGYGCITIFNTFNPAQIIIGDIVAEAGPRLIREINTVVAQRGLSEICDTTRIRLSTLPSDATLCGAGAVAISQILEHPSRFSALANRPISHTQRRQPASERNN